MFINLFTYIKNSLFTQLQRVVLIEFIRALLRQLDASYRRFLLNVHDFRYRIYANGSVISLQNHIRRELDVDAVITELDGKPVDFLVEVSGFADENRLRALLDTYKLAGKSYTFRLGAVVYSAGWRDYACESVTIEYAIEFTDYACEQGVDRITIRIIAEHDEHTEGRIYLRAEASRVMPVAMSIHVKLYVEAGQLYNSYDIVLHEGAMVKQDVIVADIAANEILRTASELQFDQWGNYVFDLEDVNGL